MPVEIYYKDYFGRRLRKITQAATAGLKKINNALYSSLGKSSSGVAVTTDPSIAPVTAAVGATLTATPTVWAEAVNNIVYQWVVNGVDVNGANAVTFDTTGLSQGDVVEFKETAESVANPGALGFVTAANSVTLTAAVAAPTVTTDVAIASGATTVGSTLTATPGTYTGSPALTYQWQAGNVDIPGETNATLDTTGLQVGDSIVVIETATNAGGSVDSTSAAVVLT